MSCKVTFKTSCTEEPILREALKKLGIETYEKATTQHYGSLNRASFCFMHEGSEFGMEQTDEGWSLIYDDMSRSAARESQTHDLQYSIQQQYSACLVEHQAQENGWIVTEIEGTDDDIELQLTQYC